MKLTPAEAVNLVELHGGLRAASRATGIPKSTLRDQLVRWRASESLVQLPELPSELEDVETLWRKAEERFDRVRRAKEARRWIDIKINTSQPIGLAFSADTHLDDPGADLRLARQHRETIVDTEGMFAIFAGDVLNNWPKGGRLASLHAHSAVTEDEGRRLALHHLEGFGAKLLACIWGNHELFSGHDLVRWLGDRLTCIAEQDEARLRITFANGRQVTMVVRHTFPGTSQWNPAHGVMKAAQMGFDADLLVSGHIHTSAGAPIIANPISGKLTHCLQISSYKIYDKYAVEKGFRPGAPIPCPVAIVDPLAEKPIDFITVMPNPEKASLLLGALRAKTPKIVS